MLNKFYCSLKRLMINKLLLNNKEGEPNWMNKLEVKSTEFVLSNRINKNKE